MDYVGTMADPDQAEYGVNPDEFGSALVDAAALLDAHLGDVDWFLPPPGAAHRTIDVPSGKLAAMSLGNLGKAANAALPSLERAQQDPNPAVRNAAAEAVKQIKG